VSGIVPFKNLKDGDTLKTINGNQLIVEIKNGKVNVGGAGILLRDVKISNGIMYSTDTVFVK
jgi:uncharacterized surface protein with fasciclin (FAS1) repeats